MKFVRLETSHLIMLGVISFGILSLTAVVLPNRLLYVLLLLLVLSALVALFLYQKWAYEQSERELENKAADDLMVLDHLPVGIVQFSPSGKEVTWFNAFAALLLSREDGQFEQDKILAFLDPKAGQTLTLGDQVFTVTVDKTARALYFWEAKTTLRERVALGDFSPVIAIVSVDNYDETTDNLADAEVSQINSFVANFIAAFANEKKIFYRRTAMDRFYLFTDYLVLSQLVADKFPILEAFRQAAKEMGLSLTLSLGIAYGNHDYQDIGRMAQNNLNMAMVRGGDQVVLKDNSSDQEFQYFGGGTNSTVKRSRTRTRAMMSAISDKIRQADRVFIVGHRQTDMDALASSVGMQFFASQLIREAYAVYDPNSMTEDVRRALGRLQEEGRTKLLSLDDALAKVGPRSLLIMVDHSKLALTLSSELYGQFREVVIVDHHRRDDDFPANASLSFIESGASSASELVTELIQFQNAPEQISQLQASILMAGIMLDTKNFSTRVTSRTFDVASYLRRQGSDAGAIQDISAQAFDEYKQVNQLVLSGEVMPYQMIIAQGNEDQVYSNVETGKAADTLLNMAGIEASFVITKNAQGAVAISARSKQQVNVQRLMERLGGGGHFNLAAAQLSGASIAQAREVLWAEIQEEMKKVKES